MVLRASPPAWIRFFSIRRSLDASELGSDTEREDIKEKGPGSSPRLSWEELAPWTSGTVVQVEIQPLCLDRGLAQESGNVVSVG